MGKVYAHIRYRNRKGGIVPGVTTILNILNKPALIRWSNNLGLQGISVDKYVDDKAEIGTLAHYLVLRHLKAQEPDTSDYSQNQIDQAENAFLSFLSWEKSHPLKPILIETPLVFEVYQYGGTLDLLAQVNGSSWLIDFKTGKGIYQEMISLNSPPIDGYCARTATGLTTPGYCGSAGTKRKASRRGRYPI